jgi:OOP family OmpA-OmpF porin/outer membrane immunogenic protein
MRRQACLKSIQFIFLAGEEIMRSTVFAIALATAGLSAVPALSHADDANGTNGGFFVNGNVGRSNLDKGVYNDDDTGYGANIGYRWALNPNVALGIEGGYTDLGKFDPRSSVDGLGIGRASVKGWTAGVNGHFNITPQWYLSGRAGLFRADIKGGYLDATGTAVNIDDTSDKYYAGAGFGYDFSNNFSVGLNYDYYKANTAGLKLDPNLVSVSAEVRF